MISPTISQSSSPMPLWAAALISSPEFLRPLLRSQEFIMSMRIASAFCQVTSLDSKPSAKLMQPMIAHTTSSVPNLARDLLPRDHPVVKISTNASGGTVLEALHHSMNSVEVRHPMIIGEALLHTKGKEEIIEYSAPKIPKEIRLDTILHHVCSFSSLIVCCLLHAKEAGRRPYATITRGERQYHYNGKEGDINKLLMKCIGTKIPYVFVRTCRMIHYL